MSAAVHVLCFGNPWHGDDGFGRHVFRRLAERPPPGARVFDAGTAGLDALPLLEGCERAILVDALRAGGRPGVVHRLCAADLTTPVAPFSLHDLGVAHLLTALAGAAAEPPGIVVIGAEVGSIRTFTDALSPPVRAAVPVAVRLVRDECGAQRAA